MYAKSGCSEKLFICMCNPRNRQLISIHVRIQFFDSCLRRFLTKNGIPLLKEPLSQLRDVLGIIDQVTNLNSAHDDTYGAHFSEGAARGSTTGWSALITAMKASPVPPSPLAMSAQTVPVEG